MTIEEILEELKTLGAFNDTEHDIVVTRAGVSWKDWIWLFVAE